MTESTLCNPIGYFDAHVDALYIENLGVNQLDWARMDIDTKHKVIYPKCKVPHAHCHIHPCKCGECN